MRVLSQSCTCLRLSGSLKPVARPLAFKASYSSQSAPPKKFSTLQKLGWTLTAAAGFAIGTGVSELTFAGSSNSANGPDDESAPTWSTFVLHSRQKISPTASIFTLKSSKPNLPSSYYDDLFSSSIFAIDIAQPQLQIVREYTPLPPAIEHATGKALVENDGAELHLLIRKEYRGEVSSYVHGLADGAELRISRPRAQVKLDHIGSDRETKQLVMVVGGTGITTAMQAIHALLETRTANAKGQPGALDSRPFVHVLWANRRREDCLGGISDTNQGGASWWTLGGLLGGSTSAMVAETELGVSPVVDELKRLKGIHGDKLKVDYFVDEEGTFITAKDIEKAVASRPAGKSCIAVSGPEGFMVNFAGERRNSKNKITARPTTGALSGLRQSDWDLMILG